MAANELTFSDKDFIVSKTDLSGKITYVNDIFVQISGFEEKELIHMPHNILRHPDMPAAVFKYLWEKIKQNEEVFAYVINKTKYDDYYWVLAHITPSLDENEKIVGYHSVRRKPSKEALNIVQSVYKEMLLLEKSRSVSQSFTYLETILKQKGLSYEEFILSF